MTAQAPDEVLFAGTWFALTAVDGEGLFDPAAHGLDPRPTGTACYRGHICRYAVEDGQLLLRDVELGAGEGWRHEDGDLPVTFTGRLLIATGDVEDRPYLNMGFRPAWMYREVRDLTFQDGALLTVADCSAELAAVRAEVVTTAVGPAPGEPTREWISRTFSLTYEYSWPRG